MGFSTQHAFQHVTSNGYVHAYRRGRVVALYNSLNLNTAFLLDAPQEPGAELYSRLPRTELERLRELGLDLRGGWSEAHDVLGDLRHKAADETVTTVYLIPAMA